jgi:hypothetical protein
MSALSVWSVKVDGQDYSKTPFRLKPGETSTLEITVSSSGPELRGFVSATTGAPAPGSLVVAFPTDRALWTNDGWSPTWIRSGIVASNGSYEIRALRGAEYYVVAIMPTPDEGWSEPSFLESAIPTASTVMLDWGTSTTLDLRIHQATRR